jgi:hypothetical protein
VCCTSLAYRYHVAGVKVCVAYSTCNLSNQCAIFSAVRMGDNAEAEAEAKQEQGNAYADTTVATV